MLDFESWASLAKCWPHSSTATVIVTGAGKLITRQIRTLKNHHGHRKDPQDDNSGSPNDELHRGRELQEATEDTLRQDYHELQLEFDRLKEKSMFQQKEAEFYDKIISATSSDNIDHRLQEIQQQLRQLCADFELFTRTNSRAAHDNERSSQHKFSLRSSLDRVTRTLLLVEEENKALRETIHLKEESPVQTKHPRLDLAVEDEEEFLEPASSLHRKKGRTDLRSQEMGRHVRIPQTDSLYEQHAQSQGRSSNELLNQISTLRDEFVSLQSQLKSAETHIMNISGNLGALLPREVAKDEFNSVISATRIWITTCVLPAISSRQKCLHASERARNVWSQDQTIRISRARNEDFRKASETPGADGNILLVIVFDVLVERVFSAKVLYGNHDLQREIDVIKRLEQSMRLNGNSSKNLYNARRWMSEAMKACLVRDDTQTLRDKFSHALTNLIVHAIGLVALLEPSNRNALDAARTSIRQEIVLPAIELGDKMACAIDAYSLNFSSYWSEPCDFETEFFRDLGNLDCRNFGEGPPRFRLDKEQALWSDDKIRRRLRAICPAIPAMILTEVDDNTWGPATTLVKQEVWVKWDPPKKPHKPRPERTGLFWFLYHRDASADRMVNTQGGTIGVVDSEF